MSRVRNCSFGMLRTGISKCPIDMKRIKYALVVERGHILKDLTAASLEEEIHADRPSRIYPLGPFIDFSKEGGEVQTTNVGYGPVGPNGLSPRRDTLTLQKSDFGLNASLLQCMSIPRDVYFIDTNNIVYGVDDGNGGLTGIPMSSIFPDSSVFEGSEKSNMTVSFCYEDAQKTFENFQAMDLGFNPAFCYGLTPVVLSAVDESGTKFKLIEKYGGLDRTEEFGEIIKTSASSVLLGAASATYEGGVITIVEASGTVALAAPSVLYKAEIKGIEYVGTELQKV